MRNRVSTKHNKVVTPSSTMDVSATRLGFVVVDVLLRRLVLPFVLLLAVLFRYNLLSLVYLLLFIVSLLLPGPRLKSQKVANVVYLILLIVFSAVTAIGQSLFQVTLATSYDLEPCDGDESIWRQVGFVRFDVPAVDVVRHLLPDVMVLLAAVLSVCVNVKVVTLHRGQVKSGGRERNGSGAESGGIQEQTEDEVNEMDDLPKDFNLPFPKFVQCYQRVSKLFLYSLEVGVFFSLGLSGVAVPSLLSFVYYVVFLVLLVIWSVHLRLSPVVRVIRAVLMFYSALHLVVLDLYQFPAAQSHIPIEPINTTQSLLARLFGLTPLIETDCSRPTELLLTAGQHYISYLSPVFILVLLWLLAMDFRLWLFTPQMLWKKHKTYFIPILDQPLNPSVYCVIKQGSQKQKLWNSYGTMDPSGTAQVSPSTPSVASPISEDSEDAVSVLHKRKRMSFKDLFRNSVRVAKFVWLLFLNLSYIAAIVAMMSWSVLYPSWPALVFLLWSVGIWLIPKVNPKNSLYFTSPLLVLYALVLLILQYIYSLDITREELPRNNDLVIDCSNGTRVGCKSFTLLIKTLLTVVCFVAFHEFVRIAKSKVKEWWYNTHHTDDGEIPLAQVHMQEAEEGSVSDVGSDVVVARSQIYEGIYKFLCSYWILAVVGSFLLIILAGEPSLLKSVYVVFFFGFMATYQITGRFWFYLSFPVWWLLVLYSALELVLVYTYQFNIVSDAWLKLYNRTDVGGGNITGQELFDSIGLRKYNVNALQNLLESLIPPAVFIAVMAMQLRYFRPKSSTASTYAGFSAFNLSTLLPASIRNAVNSWEEKLEEEEDASDVDLESTSKEQSSTSRTGFTRQRTIREPQSKFYSCYKFTVYVFNKSRTIIVELINLFWRFLELHLHKVIALVLFASTISQVSGFYWVLLLCVLIVLPLPYFNPLTYPLITIGLGVVSTVKMIYQLPIVKEHYFKFSDETCNSTNQENISGLVFNDRYSPRPSDANWIGLHSTDNFAGYIWLPVFSGLLLSLWFTARRYQAQHYHSKEITIQAYEQGSLFLNVTRLDAETSIVSAIKYLVNHFYEMYGVEVCWCMLAITVAVRIDVYGVIYAISLFLLLVTPRRFLGVVWFFYLLIHGFLLMVQYSFLMGGPPGFCFTKGGNIVYPWSSLKAPFKKWLFITDDNYQILDKTFLYADFLVYILVSLQIHYFRGNPLRRGTPEQVKCELHNFFQFQYWIDYIKYIVFQYSFWLSLFLMFFTAASRVSLFGLLYLLVGFAFLYRGGGMLTDRQRFRHISWSGLRMISWAILLLRVSLQIVDCVFWEKINNERDCILILLLFNGPCDKAQYYGSSLANCSSSTPNPVGLWVDALNFIVITLQIIIFDTQFSEMVRADLLDKEGNAKSFREVFDKKVIELQQENTETRDAELLELRERAAELTLTENKIDHILYAGVRVPEDIVVRYRMRKRRDTTTSEDAYFGVELTDSTSTTSEEPKSKLEDSEEDTQSSLSKGWKQLVAFLSEVLDVVIGWLEDSSSLYRTVVMELNQETSVSAESTPFVEQTGSYGSIKMTTTKKETSQTESQLSEVNSTVKQQSGTKIDVTAEVHEEGMFKHPSTISHTAAVSEDKDQESGEADSPESQGDKHEATSDKPTTTVLFGVRGDVLIDELHIRPSHVQEKEIEEYEAEIGEKAKEYSARFKRLMVALYYAFLSHSEYIVYFFIILNIILNGSILSLVYAVFLFTWGLLSIPWPSKRFWLTLIFYAMFVLVVKYAFQFHDIDYWKIHYESSDGLYPPRLIGIQYRENFFANAVWDVLLLITLLIHRGLLKQYGLWRSKRDLTPTSVINGLWQDFKGFFMRLLDPEISQGAKDYYVWMLVFDILCFLTIAFGVNSFGVGVQTGDITAVAEYFRTNYIPLPFVIMLLLQFISMLVDRAIYLRHSLLGKVVFNFLLLLGWHLWLFFILPSSPLTGRPFIHNPAAQCIYFFKCCYFIVSALQIVAGYPTRVLGYFLARTYTTVSWLAFLVYRLIPLLPELREVMDWAFTDTSLSLINWFKVQEIYAQLYLVKVQRTREKNSPRDLGEKQTWLIKLVMGVGVVIVLVLLIWLPLLLISIISTTNQPNPPVQVEIKVTLGSYQPLLETTVQQQGISKLSGDQYKNMLRGAFRDTQVYSVFDREFFQDDFRQVLFSGESISLWTASPPSRSGLLTQLREVKNMTNTILLQFSWSVTRTPISGLALETVSGISSRVLSYDTDMRTIDGFISILDNSTQSLNVPLPNLYPSIIRAPANGESTNFSQLTRFIQGPSNVSCNITLDQSDTTADEWWTLTQSSPHLLDTNSDTLEMVIYSERIAPPAFGFIAGLGIIGLYVSVVLVIGRFIRGYISDLPSHLIVDEILNPDPLLKLCNDIFLVRESKDFKLEEILVGKLFFIFRSPEKIVSLTENTKYKQD